jgi:hypothetical protein
MSPVGPQHESNDPKSHAFDLQGVFPALTEFIPEYWLRSRRFLGPVVITVGQL